MESRLVHRPCQKALFRVELTAAVLLAASVLAIQPGFTQQAASPSTPAASNSSTTPDVPVIDGGLGPCSLELQVNDGYGKPVASADVKVHITYGFMGIRKMDLEANTNLNGKVKFAGLPAKVHNPPLEFTATKDQLTGIATYNPATECHAKHDMVLEKIKPPDLATPSPTPTP